MVMSPQGLACRVQTTVGELAKRYSNTLDVRLVPLRQVCLHRLLGYAHRVAMTRRDGHTPTPAANEQAYRFWEWCLNAAR